MRDDVVGEHLLGLDRLPVLDAARIDGDRHFGEPGAQFLHRFDPLDDVLRGADPDDVVLDHLVVGHVGEVLHDARGVEAVTGGLEHRLRRHLVLVLQQHRGVALEEAAHHLLGLALGGVAIEVEMTGVNPDDVRLVAVLGAGRAVNVELRAQRLVGQ